MIDSSKTMIVSQFLKFSVCILMIGARVVQLTNRRDFFMLCTLMDHRNNALKCSKFKWNHKLQVSGVTAKL